VVLKAMGIEDDLNISTLRISFGNGNSLDDVDQLLKALEIII
jgi:cysteine sulfinate desulfinase/cysteine desulfurase-like protein